MKRNWRETFRWIIRMLRADMRQVTSVGNRWIERGKIGATEVTITYRNTLEEDGYSRTELLELLQLIRREEERCQWTVPEPVRCGFCGHCSPMNEKLQCPVLRGRMVPCRCPQHGEGLVQANREALNRALSKAEDGFTRNPSMASTGSLQDG